MIRPEIKAQTKSLNYLRVHWLSVLYLILPTLALISNHHGYGWLQSFLTNWWCFFAVYVPTSCKRLNFLVFLFQQIWIVGRPTRLKLWLKNSLNALFLQFQGTDISSAGSLWQTVMRLWNYVEFACGNSENRKKELVQKNGHSCKKVMERILRDSQEVDTAGTTVSQKFVQENEINIMVQKSTSSPCSTPSNLQHDFWLS